MPDKYGVGQDRDCYANSDVLINLLGITDMALLSEAEMAFTTLRLSLGPLGKLFDAALNKTKS